MTDEKLQEFKSILLKEKDHLLKELEQNSLEVSENVLDQSQEGPLDPEAASDLFEQERNLVERDYLQYELREVERALQLLEEGKYGYSIVSGKPIPLDRLEALPWATRLVEEEAGIKRN
jgi:RNA polymerase-binding transcription factor DksA